MHLPFYSATIIRRSFREALMATRRKAKGKARKKRKKTPATKAATRKKTARKSKTSRKTSKKKSSRLASPRKAAPTAKIAVKPAPVSAPAQPAAARPEQRIGVVTHYYGHLSVATMRLEPDTTLRVGDVIHVHGHTTDFTQRVESLEVNRAPVSEVGPNDDFGLKVIEHAREHDAVFKVRS